MTGRRFVVTGTDTDVGKTIFAAGLVRAVDGSYWKPIQSGLADEIDSQVVARLSALPPDRILPEAYRLTNPLSPHRASELDGIEIDTARLVPPDIARPLVIEGAGGLMVPITRRVLQSDLFVKWQIPVILVARTGLGTINHSLLSIAALRMYEIPLHGIAFVGDANEDNERTICEIGKAKHLGRLPRLAPLTAESLVTAFSAAFRLEDFV
jgi:dethiobiotin synthetase